MRADITPNKALLTGSATTYCRCHNTPLSAVGEGVPREVTHQM